MISNAALQCGAVPHIPSLQKHKGVVENRTHAADFNAACYPDLWPCTAMPTTVACRGLSPWEQVAMEQNAENPKLITWAGMGFAAGAGGGTTASKGFKKRPLRRNWVPLISLFSLIVAAGGEVLAIC